MKVLIVRTFPDILNISAYNVQEIGLAKALVRKGVECGVVFYNGKERSRTEQFSFEKEGVSYSFPIYWLRGFGFYKNGFMPEVYRLRKEYDVIQVHEYDQIFSWMMYTRMKKPTVIYHGPYYHEYARGYNLKCRVFDACFLRWRKHDDVVAMTKSELASDFLREKGFVHVHTVGVGVDEDKFRIGKGEEVVCPVETDTEKFRLLYVGKIEERRNVYFLINMFEKLYSCNDRVQLIIVGDGEKEYADRFRERICSLVEKGTVLYCPKATQKELALIYQRSNLFVFTSNYEIFGMVLLEALYFGLPVLSTPNGGSSVLIRDGYNGYVMQEFQEELWIRRIKELLSNPEKYEKMRRNAHKLVEEHFLWDRLADRFIEGYEEAVMRYQEKKK